MTKTYLKWRPWFDAKFKEVHAANNTSWDSINRFYCMTGSVLNNRNFTKSELDMMSYRVMDPLTGLMAAVPKMKQWHEVCDTIREICVGQDGGLKVCPDDPEKYGMHRLLYMHQDSHLLLLTTLILHESAYKVVVDFVYDCSDDKRYKRTQTVERAEHLAKQGFDVRDAADYFLRNGIAHSSFRIIDDGSVLVADNLENPSSMQYNPKSTSPPLGTKQYTREELISGFMKRQSLIADVLAGVVYWFEVNHGPIQLFDDQFFGSPEREAVVEAALEEMGRPSNILNWKSILAKFEKVLPS